MRRHLRTGLWTLLLVGFASLLLRAPAWSPALAQQPTGSIPTVTRTPPGPVIRVVNPDGANVRAGPSSFDYAAVGYLLPGETAPAIGRSPQGEWVQIIYLGAPGGVGWVYAPLVVFISTSSFLPIVEPPPTATPRTTPTIDPTMAAAFGVELTPTRRPTFTPPPPLQIPTFEPIAGTSAQVPMGLVIVGLAVVGIMGAVISFLRGR